MAVTTMLLAEVGDCGVCFTCRIFGAAFVAKTMFVDLGRLKAFKGSQNYPVPAGVNLAGYGSVVIWCEQFGVLISPAALKFEK